MRRVGSGLTDAFQEGSLVVGGQGGVEEVKLAARRHKLEDFDDHEATAAELDLLPDLRHVVDIKYGPRMVFASNNVAHFVYRGHAPSLSARRSSYAAV